MYIPRGSVCAVSRSCEAANPAVSSITSAPDCECSNSASVPDSKKAPARNHRGSVKQSAARIPAANGATAFTIGIRSSRADREAAFISAKIVNSDCFVRHSGGCPGFCWLPAFLRILATRLLLPLPFAARRAGQPNTDLSRTNSSHPSSTSPISAAAPFSTREIAAAMRSIVVRSRVSSGCPSGIPTASATARM